VAQLPPKAAVEKVVKPPQIKSSEAGFTMIELIVAAAMMVVITAAATSMLISVLNRQPKVTAAADQIGDARIGLERMVNEIRQGSGVVVASSSASKLVFNTYIHAASCTSNPTQSAAAISCQVTYECAVESGKSTYACTRKVSTATAAKFVTKLASPIAFTYTPTAVPAYVGVKISLPTTGGGGTTVLEGGAALRNLPSNLTN
jgi:prepilin-type N-terminal cleavage/methylation domain-containing protein